MVKIKEEIEGENNNLNKKQDRRVLTLFLVLFPSLIIAGNWSSMWATNFALKLALIFYQFVILKVFLDSYYGYK